MSRIFKQASIEDELMLEMEQAQINSIISEESYDDRIVVEAMEHLNKAAVCLENIGSINRASEVTNLMVSLAKAKKKDKKQKSKTSKDEAEDVFRFFGFKIEDLK